jgi:GTP-binding protein
MNIRNIAIIAHVDHGKTTLTDALMRQTDMVEAGVSMDSNDLEQERGITIYAKNTSVFYNDTKINIVDTPGHADFSSEVERVLRSIDSVLLVVDAAEGPMPQTRFVLKKSLELGLQPIVVINKIDKPAADPDKCEEDVLELFYDLGASDDQADFPVVYAIGKDGIAMKKLGDDSNNLDPLLDTILQQVPVAHSYVEGEDLRAQVFNLGYDKFIGQLGIARIYEGKIVDGQEYWLLDGENKTKAKVTKLFTFQGLERSEVSEAYAGDIVMIAGFEGAKIGATISNSETAELLPSISIDEPTITLNFLVNNSPFAGQAGKYVTTRQIKERLDRELKLNVGLQVEPGDGDSYQVSGRGELHIAVLLENMRREGFELQVSQPQVIEKEVDGVLMEPYEELTIDIPTDYQGSVIEKLGVRGFVMQDMKTEANQTRMIFEGPTRGLLGYRGEFVIDTRGEGILASNVIGFKPYYGDIQKREVGSMVSMATGKALGFALYNLQNRGQLYIGANTEVYEGMVIGNTAKGIEMVANPTKGKQLTNMRTQGTDENIVLTPHLQMTIERGLEIIGDDEYLEVTPDDVRLRKQELSESKRNSLRKKSDKA